MVNAEPAAGLPALSTVHEAVRRAVLCSAEEAAQKAKDDSVNFKCRGQVKRAAAMILHHAGTDMSKYLTACVELLVHDYAGENGLKKIAEAEDVGT